MRNLFCIIILFLAGIPAHAASISIAPHDIPLDDVGTLTIFIDTEGAAINALELVLSLSEQDVIIEEIHEGTSLVSFWTGTPTIENNSVALAGIIPGGFQGEGTVMTLRVRGVRETTTALRVDDVSVLLNDGRGTEVPTRLGDMTVTVSAEISGVPLEDDITPPEPFTVSVVSDASIDGGAFVAIFATHDKQSGIATYEIQETRSHAPDNTAWVPAVSPYRLSDQTLSSRIFVRATDYAGNIRVVQYETDEGISVVEGGLYLMVLLIVVLLLFALYVRHTHQKRIGLSNA